MGGRCADCAEELSIGRRIRGKARCATCEAAYAKEVNEARQRQQAEFVRNQDEFREVIGQIIPGADIGILKGRIMAARNASPLPEIEIHRLETECVSSVLSGIRSDGVIDQAEDRWLNQVLSMLGTSMNDTQYRDYLITALNSGLRLEDHHPPEMLLKPDEQIHIHFPASRLERTEQQEIEWEGTELSTEMGKASVGTAISQGRAKVVTTGSKLERVDSGPIVATSKRVVFLGGNGTYEVALEQLAGVRFADGSIRLQVSDGHPAPRFEVGTGASEILATVILTSAKRLNGTLPDPKPGEISETSTPPMPLMLQRIQYVDSLPADQGGAED